MNNLPTKNIIGIDQYSIKQILPNLGIHIDPITRTVRFRGELIKLPRYEFEVLQHLIKNSGRVVSRKKLVELLYGGDNSVDSNVLDVYIHNLRKKFGQNTIRTIRGIGYVAAFKNYDGLN
jgi:two-component system, OmpR family, response regulator QseB